MGVIGMVSQSLVPAAIGRGLDAGVAGGGDLGAAAVWSLAVLGLAVTQAVGGVLRHRIAVENWLIASYRAMQLLGRHGAHAGVAVRRRLPTGEVVAAATNDAIEIGGAFDVTARLSGAVVSYVVVAALMLETSTMLGLLVLIGVPLTVLVVGPLMRPLQHRQRDQRAVAGRLTALGADTVSGLRVLRGIGGEPAFLERYRLRSDELREAGVRVARLQATMDAAQVLLPGIFLVSVTWLGARLALEGELSAGDIVAFYGYAFFLVVPIRTAVEAVDHVIRALVGARRVITVLTAVPDVAEPVADPVRGAALRDPRSGLVATPGQLLGVVSADPDESAAIAHRLGRGRIGQVVVSEAEPRLFTGPLRGELDPWGHARDDATLFEALHVSAADDVLDALPDGLDAHVDEGGRGFSGGQRQRLALARTLVADPEVLVLVDPTSAVDAHTEVLVAARLRAARDGRTTVVTSVSPLVLDRCDEVAFVVGGQVEAVGTHRDLLGSHPLYRRTVTRGEDQ